jgi:hypothetical protein
MAKEKSLKSTMDPTTALALQLTGPVGLGGLFGFVGIPSRRSARKDLSIKAEEVFRGVTALIDGFLLRAIEARTKDEFVTARDQVFAEYAQLVMSLMRLVSIVVPRQTIEILSVESFSELEAEFREHGLTSFGTAAKDQAIFTVWTLRRTSNLLSKIAGFGQLAKELEERDAALAADFSAYAAWTGFHLDCLTAAIRFKKTIQPEVLIQIEDGLRAAVNAYGVARQGVVLRSSPQTEPAIAHAAWDEEDQELLDSSMCGMEVETL